MKSWRHNLLGVVGAMALYATLTYLLHFLDLEGRDALALLFGFHIAFGMLGYALFAGSVLVRSTCIVLAIVAYGVVMEFIYPDPEHALVQVFVYSFFGVVAAVAAPGGRVLEKALLRCQEGRQTGG